MPNSASKATSPSHADPGLPVVLGIIPRCVQMREDPCAWSQPARAGLALRGGLALRSQAPVCVSPFVSAFPESECLPESQPLQLTACPSGRGALCTRPLTFTGTCWLSTPLPRFSDEKQVQGDEQCCTCDFCHPGVSQGLSLTLFTGEKTKEKFMGNKDEFP